MTTTQGAYVSRYWIAWGLGVPESQVRVIKPMLGGGFGGKLDVFAHELYPCLFSKMTGHPVLKRDEVFMCTRTRHPISFEIESAFTKEGKLLAKRCKHILGRRRIRRLRNRCKHPFAYLRNLPV